MAVHFRPDEIDVETEISVPQRDDDDEGGLGEGLAIAARSSIVSLCVGAVLLFFSLQLMKKSLIAADHLLHRGGGDHWQEMWMPAVLFAFFGAIFGAAVAWRISARTSLGGALMSVAAGGVALVLAVAGGISAFVIFGGSVPTMCWFSLAAMTLAAIGGAFGYTTWTG